MANSEFYWPPSGERQSFEFGAETQCRYIELLRCPGQSTATRLEGEVNDTSLEQWFAKVLKSKLLLAPIVRSLFFLIRGLQIVPMARRANSRPGFLAVDCEYLGTCGLNSVTNEPEVSISSKAFSMIKERLGLPDHYLTNISRDRITRTTSFSYHGNGTVILGLIFKVAFFSKKFYQVSISYYPELNLTYGLVLARNTSEGPIPIPAFLESYQNKPDVAFHPLLLPIFGIGIQIRRTSRRIRRWNSDINDLEDVMGQHEPKSRPIGNPLEMDFTSATRKLNHVSKRVDVDILNLELLKVSLETVDKWGENLIDKGQETIAGIQDATWIAMQEEITSMKENCRSLLLLAEYEEKRMKSLIQAVYQFMAQKDAKVNIELALNSATIAKASKDDSAIMREIAIETKRDSSAMNIIAPLGMFFLPGTFVAAIFATPIFNWDEEGMPHIKKGFGLYWAVTVPLTLTVLLSWGGVMLIPWKEWVLRFNASSRVRGRNMELTETGP